MENIDSQEELCVENDKVECDKEEEDESDDDEGVEDEVVAIVGEEEHGDEEKAKMMLTLMRERFGKKCLT